MKPQSTTYKFRNRVSALAMVLALLWLTVSTPFVYAQQQACKKAAVESGQCTPGDDNTNPLNSTTEEKTESGVNTLSEYLHDVHLAEQHFITLSSYYKCHSSDLYFAFHPDTLSPPPDRA